MYEFPVTGVWEIDLESQQFGITIETTIVLTVDGVSWSHDRYEGDTTLVARTLWDEQTAEFDVRGGDGGHNTHMTDEPAFLRWAQDVVRTVKPTRVDVEEPRTMSPSEV